MVFRGKDPIALEAIRAYIAAHPDESHRESATERLMVFQDYQRLHPDRVNICCTSDVGTK